MSLTWPLSQGHGIKDNYELSWPPGQLNWQNECPGQPLVPGSNPRAGRIFQQLRGFHFWEIRMDFLVALCYKRADANFPFRKRYSTLRVFRRTHLPVDNYVLFPAKQSNADEKPLTKSQQVQCHHVIGGIQMPLVFVGVLYCLTCFISRVIEWFEYVWNLSHQLSHNTTWLSAGAEKWSSFTSPYWLLRWWIFLSK